MVWGICYRFKIAPSEIWKMDLDELSFWTRGVIKVGEWLSGKEE
jgi:hypothetical protein